MRKLCSLSFSARPKAGKRPVAPTSQGTISPGPFSLLISRSLIFLNIHLILIIVIWKIRTKTNTMTSPVGKYFWAITLNSNSHKCFLSERLSSSGLRSPSILRNSLCSLSHRLLKPFTGAGQFCQINKIF